MVSSLNSASTALPDDDILRQAFRGGLKRPPFFITCKAAGEKSMNQNPIAEAVIRLAAPVVESLGLVIWGVEVAQSGRMVVRLFVDVPSDGRNPHAVAEELAGLAQDDGPDAAQPALPSASIDQCEEISRHLGLALEVEDIIPQAYVLEVSTPGFNRLFFSTEQMRPYVGDMVEARMQAAYAPRADMAPRRTWRGRLGGGGLPAGPGRHHARRGGAARGRGACAPALGHDPAGRPRACLPRAGKAGQARRGRAAERPAGSAARRTCRTRGAADAAQE